MERLTIPDVRVDEHTTRRTMIDVRAVKKHAMDFYWRLKAYEDTGLTPEEIEKLRGHNGQLMLERNYVMSIIADITKAGKTWMCQYCAHCKGIVSGMADCDSKEPCVMPYGQFELKRPEPPKEER